MKAIVKFLVCALATVSAVQLRPPLRPPIEITLLRRKGEITDSGGSAPIGDESKVVSKGHVQKEFVPITTKLTLLRSVLPLTVPKTELTPKVTAKQELTSLQNAATGAAAGVFEIVCTMPNVFMQFSSQAGYARPSVAEMVKNPLVWWRGFGSLAPGNGAIVLSQFWAHGVLTNKLKQVTGQQELTSGQQVGVATSAGAFSSLCNGPADFVTIYMQKNPGMSISQAIRSISETYGISRIFRGVYLSTLREGIYTAGYAGFAPQVKEYLKNELDLSGASAHALSSVICGFGAAVPTQPLDIQADAGRTKYPTALAPWIETFAKQGITGFWTGFQWRMSRLIVGIGVMVKFQEMADDFFLSKLIE